jgi:uncharacterized membrane protein
MKNGRRIVAYIVYMVLGLALVVLGILEIVDPFWSGMGGALIAVGVIRMIHILRYRNDESYRENVEIETKDERNQFIRNKAWAWAGYLFVLIAAISTIVLKLLGQDLLSIAAGFAVCILTLLYWVCYLVLKKKY